MATVVDIHPHVISKDTVKYPLNPLGGIQSDWSRERPVPYPDMLVAMDEAGVDKSALVHSSTAYGYDNTYCARAVAAASVVLQSAGGIITNGLGAPWVHSDDGSCIASNATIHGRLITSFGPLNALRKMAREKAST